ncbi:hypothetical protein, partial [Desulfovibrio porci]|uniref:hypothetical protein n=1 Tax=Desulfovibrio porci TaxID=2605782 RepID=UPI003A8CC620
KRTVRCGGFLWGDSHNRFRAVDDIRRFLPECYQNPDRRKKCRFTGIPWLQSVVISHGMIILSMFFDNPPPSLADAFAP